MFIKQLKIHKNMQHLFVFLNKGLKKGKTTLLKPFDRLITFYILYSNGIIFSTFKSNGIPKLNVGIGGKCTMGSNFRMNNREISNPIGRFNRCSIIVGKKRETDYRKKCWNEFYSYCLP